MHNLIQKMTFSPSEAQHYEIVVCLNMCHVRPAGNTCNFQREKLHGECLCVRVCSTVCYILKVSFEQSRTCVKLRTATGVLYSGVSMAVLSRSIDGS